MTLPPFHDALESLVQGHSLKKSYEKISGAYRSGESSAVLKEASDYLAYAVARMPATYAVLEKVLGEVAKRWPHKIRTFLDLGSGPGTAFWAQPFSLESYTAVERDPSFISLAKKMGARGTWIQSSLETYDVTKTDLILFSYVIAEIKEYLPLVLKAFEKAEVLVVVEPGTPAGFERVRAIRAALIQAGASILAPCSSEGTCPMTEGNWCHFSQRLARSRLHRVIKGGELGYEDEKYSYVIATKTKGFSCEARIVAPPVLSKARVQIPVCKNCALETLILKKTKLKWGDAFESLDTKPEESYEESDRNKG